MRKRMLAIALAFVLPAAHAQFVSGIKVEPAEIKTGESAKITVSFDVQGGINCGLRVHFGDGSTQDFKINQNKDIPLVTSHVYGRSGKLTVKAEPKTVDMTFKCGGKNQETALNVLAPPPPPPPAAATTAKPVAAMEGPQCPDGWNVVRKSISRKTGAYTCAAKTGTKVPEPKLACPGDLTYFENAKKGRLGCQP